nr:mat [Porphyrostromium boryanum]
MLKHKNNISSLRDLNSYILADNLSWSKIHCFVKRIQKEIYEYSCNGNSIGIRSKQEMCWNSKESCFLAIRCVLNKHLRHQIKIQKQRPDFLFVDSNYFFCRTYLNQLTNQNDVTFTNLTIQELLLIALRPEWEGRIEDNSYGFSPHLGTTQAIIKTYSILSKNQNYENCIVLVGKLSNWLGGFNASLILKKSNYKQDLRHYLQSICTPSLFSSSLSVTGTKFQSIEVLRFSYNSIALLIANMLFYGLETSIKWKFDSLNKDQARWSSNKVQTIVCSNHFLVIFPANNIKHISLTINLIRSFFNSTDLNLQNRSLTVQSIYEGFDFLGFNFKRCHNKSEWDNQRAKLIVTPTRNNIKKHLLSMRYCLYHKDRLNRWRANAQMTQYDVINQLNPLIREFTQHYRDLTSPFILKTLDRTLNEIVYRYAIKKYKSNRSKKWNDNWTTVMGGKKVIAYYDTISNTYKPLYLHDTDNFS